MHLDQPAEVFLIIIVVDFLSGEKNVCEENICEINDLKAGQSTVWGLIEPLVNKLDKEVVIFDSSFYVFINTAVY